MADSGDFSDVDEEWHMITSRRRGVIIQKRKKLDGQQSMHTEPRSIHRLIEQYNRGNDLLQVAASFRNLENEDINTSRVHRTSKSAEHASGMHRSVKSGRLARRSIEPYPRTKRIDAKFNKMKTSMDIAKKALQFMKNGDTITALSAIDEAFSIWPENDAAHAIRGKIYLKMTNGKPSSLVKKAFIDFEDALKLNPRNSVAKAGFGRIMFESAKLHLKEKEYNKAEMCFNATLKYNDAHADAAKLLTCLKYLRNFQELNLV